MKKNKITFLKGLLIGLGGSLLFKLIEYSFQGFFSWQIFTRQLLFLIPIPLILVLIFQKYKIQSHHYILIPVFYRVIAGIYNFFITKNWYMLSLEIIEAGSLALLTGYIVYLLVKKLK